MKVHTMFAKLVQMTPVAFRILVTVAFAGSINVALAQTVTVVEYYNAALDAYFITGRDTEQTLLDAQPTFTRTGMSFRAVAASAASPNDARVCRFYVNIATPFANSHFYGREKTDCDMLLALALPGFNWEGYDFAIAQPIAGQCPSGSTPIYRSFRAATVGKTANHRYTSSQNTFSSSALAGFVGEEVAFCAASATDISFTAPTQCGTEYFPNVRARYRSVDSDGLTDNWVTYYGSTKVMFGGRLVQPVFEQYDFGDVNTTMIEDGVDSWTEVGFNLQSESGSSQGYFLPPTVIPRHMAPGQIVYINRYASYESAATLNSPRQTGGVIFLGQEPVSVLGRTYMACRFSTQLATQYPSLGLTMDRQTTTWVVQGIGIVKASVHEATYDDFGTGIGYTTTDVTVVDVQSF